MDFASFCSIFQNQPTELDTSQVKILFYCLLEGDDDMLNTASFWNQILPPLTSQRKKVIHHLWENLNVKNEDRVELVRFKNRFFGKFHPKVLDREAGAVHIENEFLQNIDFHGQIFGNSENFMKLEQFRDFMFCLSGTFKEDNKFLSLLVDCFRLSEFFGIYSEPIPMEEASPVKLLESRPSYLGDREMGRRNPRSRRGNGRGGSRRDEQFYGHRSNVVKVNKNEDDPRDFEEEERPKANFYDQREKSINLYQSSPVKSRRQNERIPRNYNIISGRIDPESRANNTHSRRSDIKKNFYDELNYQQNKGRDISQKRRVDTDRRSRLSRSRKPSSRSIPRSQISMT